MSQAYLPYFQAALALIGVILLILGVSWILKRVSGISGFITKDTGEIQIQAMKQVDPKAKLMVIGWRGHSYLVGIGEQGVNVIAKDKAQLNNEGPHVTS